jgi:hypothetical protein
LKPAEPIESERFIVETGVGPVVHSATSLALSYRTPSIFETGGNLWAFYDIRQFRDRTQTFLQRGIVVKGPGVWETNAMVDGGVVRTFDTHPFAPEFLHAIHLRNVGSPIPKGTALRISLNTHADGFLFPENAIDAFRFWLVEDPKGELTFYTDGGKYHVFLPRERELSVLVSNALHIAAGPAERLRVTASDRGDRTRVQVTTLDRFGNPTMPDQSIDVTGGNGTVSAHPDGPLKAVCEIPPAAPGTRVHASCAAIEGSSDPVHANRSDDLSLFWGDIHGMMFNQRPVADHFRWAEEVAHLDFAGAQYFSYTACTAGIWEEMLDAWRVYNRPEAFISLPSVEFGTPPDGSHRLGFFPNPDSHAPVFCEDRPEARDPRLLRRFHPDTVFCKDFRELADFVDDKGGFVQGHHHTAFYERETVSEIYQKQQMDPRIEEAKINRAIQFQGLRLGIVGGSDTHDSRPANPDPEPGPSNPAGLTGVWCERLDRDSLFDAFRNRRCYATTGPRIYVDYRVNGIPMGGTAQAGTYSFTLEVGGTADVTRVDLFVNGRPVETHSPSTEHVTLSGTIEAPHSLSGVNYAYVRLEQSDGNRAWTSPIWLEPELQGV